MLQLNALVPIETRTLISILVEALCSSKNSRGLPAAC